MAYPNQTIPLPYHYITLPISPFQTLPNLPYLSLHYITLRTCNCSINVRILTSYTSWSDCPPAVQMVFSSVQHLWLMIYIVQPECELIVVWWYPYYTIYCIHRWWVDNASWITVTVCTWILVTRIVVRWVGNGLRRLRIASSGPPLHPPDGDGPYMYMDTYEIILVCVHLYRYLLWYVYVYVYIYIYIYVHTYTCVYIYIYMYTWVCMYLYMYISMYPPSSMWWGWGGGGPWTRDTGSVHIHIHIDIHILVGGFNPPEKY